jgi:glutathione S-transferase
MQLPYLIDGARKITQSNAILRYIARKHDLCEWGWLQGAGAVGVPWACLGWVLRVCVLCGCRWGDRRGEDPCGHFGEPIDGHTHGAG